MLPKLSIALYLMFVMLMMVWLSFDFLQMLPVVPEGSREDVVDVCIGILNDFSFVYHLLIYILLQVSIAERKFTVWATPLLPWRQDLSFDQLLSSQVHLSHVLPIELWLQVYVAFQWKNSSLEPLPLRCVRLSNVRIFQPSLQFVSVRHD